MATRDGFAFRQHFGEAGHAQALRRDEQKLQLAVQIIDAAWREAARSRPEWMQLTASPRSLSLAT